jgi:hypothetical protein
MKYIKLLFLQGLLLFCFASQLNAQVNKKPLAKKTNGSTKPKPKQQEEVATPQVEKAPESFTSQVAGRYAKSFSRKMYNSIDFQEKKQDYSLSINKWKAYHLEGDKWQFFIDVTIRWKSGSSGWPTQWTDVEYSGVIMCDEFGCEPFFMIKTKNEPAPGFLNLFAKSSPLEAADEKLKGGLVQMDGEWLSNVNYMWAPSGCLDE